MKGNEMSKHMEVQEKDTKPKFQLHQMQQVQLFHVTQMNPSLLLHLCLNYLVYIQERQSDLYAFYYSAFKQG